MTNEDCGIDAAVKLANHNHLRCSLHMALQTHFQHLREQIININGLRIISEMDWISL